MRKITMHLATKTVCAFCLAKTMLEQPTDRITGGFTENDIWGWRHWITNIYFNLYWKYLNLFKGCNKSKTALKNNVLGFVLYKNAFCLLLSIMISLSGIKKIQMFLIFIYFFTPEAFCVNPPVDLHTQLNTFCSSLNLVFPYFP